MYSPYSRQHILQQIRYFSVSNRYGSSIFGVTDLHSNSKLVELPKNETLSPSQIENMKLSPKLNLVKWDSKISVLGLKYFFRKTDTPIGYYQIKTNGNNPQNIVMLSSINNNLLETKTLYNSLYEQTRGFGGQVILNGRGVKAYFEPKYPHLMIRLGVGAKPIDATRICTMYQNKVKIDVDRTGMILTVHGYDKQKVGNIIYRLYKITKVNPYTMKGGHIAFYNVKQKIPKKK